MNYNRTRPPSPVRLLGLLLIVCALTMTTVLLDLGDSSASGTAVRFEARLASLHVFVSIGRPA